MVVRDFSMSMQSLLRFVFSKWGRLNGPVMVSKTRGQGFNSTFSVLRSVFWNTHASTVPSMLLLPHKSAEKIPKFEV